MANLLLTVITSLLDGSDDILAPIGGFTSVRYQKLLT